jgi:hypothetical protein
VQQFKAWLPHVRCTCGERLHFVERASRQIGAAAVWEMQCTGACAPVHLATSPSLFGNDFEINYELQHGCETCAVPFDRLNDLMRYVGLGQLSTRDNNSMKARAHSALPSLVLSHHPWSHRSHPSFPTLTLRPPRGPLC